MLSLRQPLISGVITHQRATRPVVDILSIVSTFVSVLFSDFFVADVDDMNSYALFVDLFSHSVRSDLKLSKV